MLDDGERQKGLNCECGINIFTYKECANVHVLQAERLEDEVGLQIKYFIMAGWAFCVHIHCLDETFLNTRMKKEKNHDYVLKAPVNYCQSSFYQSAVEMYKY